MSSPVRLSRNAWLMLLICIFGWGFSWTVIKYALAEIPPLSFRGVSAFAAGMLTLLLVRASGASVAVARAHWPKLGMLAFFNVLSWNVLSTYGVLYLPSGRAALLAYTMPLWCVPLSVWLLNDRLDPRRCVALLLGGAGVAVLMGQDVMELMQAPLGAILMVSAALCWACGMVLMKRWALPLETMSLTGWQLLLGSLPMLPAAVWVDGIPPQLPGAGALAALAFSALVTFMLCYWAWNRLVLMVPVAVSSLSSLLTPLVGVTSGALFLGEQPGWAEALAVLLILGAVAVINLGGRRAPVA
ncbi:DMT family transporter [Uliginosibacterium sp. 31-12]|uniref:DMT family transporter n=1 Tax=Uliginosibacterium sp. 31-12 TaxID=3062781 RepID=UPI0026E4617F|nr:EamA family transporter [Uliginosibacterium sp. 31-12]MDO6386886.1 EamA family transporter [Uliginosibacterium sp. 31-12]